MSAVRVEMVRIELLRTTSKEWRWQVTASNGNRIASSTEFYRRRQGAIFNLMAVTGFVVPDLGKSREPSFRWWALLGRRDQSVLSS